MKGYNFSYPNFTGKTKDWSKDKLAAVDCLMNVKHALYEKIAEVENEIKRIEAMP